MKKIRTEIDKSKKDNQRKRLAAYALGMHKIEKQRKEGEK